MCSLCCGWLELPGNPNNGATGTEDIQPECTQLLSDDRLTTHEIRSDPCKSEIMALFASGACPIPSGATCLVVGGNRGLGLEICKCLIQGGVTTYATTRKSNSAMETMSHLENRLQIIENIELEDEQVGNKISEAMPKDLKIDYLCLVAGYFTTETFDVLNISEERKMMEICAFAPLRIIQSLIKANLLTSGSKIGMITSEGGSIGLRTVAEGGGNYGHHMSKCAQNMMGKLLAIDIQPMGIALVMIHPGFLKTEMTAHYAQFYEEFGAVFPEEAVVPILTAVVRVDINDPVPGKFIAPMGSNGLGLGVHALPNSHLDPFGELPW
jgi:NAD(P)-dependent dehydrogenase (short-subunit alcohol dehydrogenase family)